MPSNLPSSFASAAAGQNSNRDARSGSRVDGRGNTSGEWSRPGRSTNGTLTFRRTSTNPTNPSFSQLPTSDTAQSAAGDPAVISAMPVGSTAVDAGPQRYTREQMLAIFDMTEENPSSDTDVAALFMPGWNPGQANGPASRGWGKTGDTHVVPQDPDICWDLPGSSRAVGLQEMTPDEKELFTSDVNSTMKPPAQNKEGNHAPGGLNGRKTSLSHGVANNFGLASPSSASRPGTRRRETTDTNPYSGGGGLTSPTSATRPPRDTGSLWFERKQADQPNTTYEEPEEEVEPRDQSNKSLPFGGLIRNNTAGGGASFGTSPSPWPPSNVGGIGSFGNFALPGSGPAIGEKRPGNGQSRLAHLIPKDSSDSIGARGSEGQGVADAARAWRARPRTDTDPFGDENLSGSAVLGGAQDTSPPPMAHPQLHSNVFDTPVKGSAGDFGMSGLHLGGHGEHETPLSPSETNPYRSPPGDRGEHDDGGDRPHGIGAGSEPASHFGGGLPRSFAHPGFDGSDRSQTSSVGAKAYPSLGNLGGWPSSNTPDRERAPFGGFGGSLFGSVGELQSPSLASLGGVFGPAAAGGLGGSGSFGRGSKLGSLFPPAMQAQMQSHDNESLEGSIPDLRQSNPLGAIGRNAVGDPARDTESPMRANRNAFADIFNQAEARGTPASSEGLHVNIPTTSQGQSMTPVNAAPGFPGPQSATEPPSAQSRTMVMPDRMRWTYLDPQGQQQGPFTGLEMNDWYKANFFTPDLRVKKLEDTEFEPLGQLIRRIGNSREPFLVPQIGIPHGPPSQAGPFSPNSSGVIQPPLVGAFPSFGRTLTAEEQNNLERRKQEEQYLMARQREYLNTNQGSIRGPMPGGLPGLNHHSSAHSLHSQPSFGSITSPIAMPPQPPIGAIGTGGSFFDALANRQPAAPGNSTQGLEIFNENDLARLSDQERQMLASIQNTGTMGGNVPQQQPIGMPSVEPGVRGQLPGSHELSDDAEGFRGRLQEFEQLRAQRDAEGMEQHQDQNAYSPRARKAEGGANIHSSPGNQAPESQYTLDQGAEDTHGSSKDDVAVSNKEFREYQQAQAQVAAQKLSGLPMPFPPPSSDSPLPAPAPRRVKSYLPEQYADGSRSGTPDATSTTSTQPPPLAPWAKESNNESHRGPSLKEIQQAEAAKAAKAEQEAALARRAQMEQEAARERERERAAATAAPGLPTSSTWGTASPVSAGPATSPWTKPTPGKGPAPSPVVSQQVSDKKKTLADIQREEEARKQKAKELAVQTGQAAATGKRYADLASKPNALPPSSQAAAIAAAAANAPVAAGWATVGAGGKVKAPIGPGSQTRTTSATQIKPTAAPSPRPTVKTINSTPAVAGRSEAMEEFNKWLHHQLTRGITGVTDIDAFASSLLSFPLMPDIISDAIYANSKTMNGQQFASEFIRRKKLAEKGVVEKQPANSPSGDAQSSSGGGWNEVAKKSNHKEAANDANPIQGTGFKCSHVTPSAMRAHKMASQDSGAMAPPSSGPEDTLTPPKLLAIEESLGDSDFLDAFKHPIAQDIVKRYAQNVSRTKFGSDTTDYAGTEPYPVQQRSDAIRLGFACFNAFLQSNVTGPVVEGSELPEEIFVSIFSSSSPEHQGMKSIRSHCQRSLDTDGVSVYSYIPYIELFCLARFIFNSGEILPIGKSEPEARHLSWIRLRIHLWHYKLLTQPSLGSGSLFTKSGRWTDVPTLQELIEGSLLETDSSIFGSLNQSKDSAWPREAQIQFHLEHAHCHILLGDDAKARHALKAATDTSGFAYALSGALGKRTRFQERDISQLVVLAKSLSVSDESGESESLATSTPAPLPLNNDTLLEKIEFSQDQVPAVTSIPAQLQDITPDNQPDLRPEDQIILLTEATIRDTFSAADSLTSEEILPFAVRVVDHKATNWQIYTQALLVRSRIELNKSRTIERAVLQMQAVTDQVLVDTQQPASSDGQIESQTESSIPSIKVTAGDTEDHTKPTSFLPAIKPSESASARERLRYVHALASPPRWHLESELAFAWTAVGSLISALEIFKRLRHWPEVALCLATAAATDDPDGRGSGGEEKARAIIRWRLFHRTAGKAADGDSASEDDYDSQVDTSSLRVADFCGPERSPPPPNAPRLWCILGDLENDAKHYERAWEVSNRRFARAQKSLGELHLQNKEWVEARDAYKLAVGVNRLNPELWSRLGDIELRLGNFPNATEAFQRAISSANDAVGGEGARTWSNLGSSLLSWYREVITEGKARQEKLRADEAEDLDGMVSTKRAAEQGRTATQLLRDALIAFKRGATIAGTNWRIWDNVVTLAASLKPSPDLDDVILGIQHVIWIRKTEEALDLDVLTLLVREATKTPVAESEDNQGIHEPAKGTIESKIVTLFENEIAPLVTSNSAAWALVSRLRAWRRDWAGALDAAEKGWRAATAGGGVGVGGVGGTLSATSVQESDWRTSEEAWDTVVQRTEELVAAYENYGSRLESIGERWRGKARSAIRSVLGKAKENWEEDERWKMLQGSMQDLKG
ncbi:hypothetical protein F5Y15DRAFT_406899 [Xylariaceae sp. FL0016]|nr:hypothetical protein F5Y15DRAFT_406899 [Xylariaceae sp. FL0016]